MGALAELASETSDALPIQLITARPPQVTLAEKEFGRERSGRRASGAGQVVVPNDSVAANSNAAPIALHCTVARPPPSSMVQ